MSMVPDEDPDAGPTERHVIKRYANRKLYDTKDSRYVTLLQIAEMIRANEPVQIIDNETQEDKTHLTFALIISEELKARSHGIPVATLKALILQRGERILEHLRDSPIRRLILGDGTEEQPRGSLGSVSSPQGNEDSSGSDRQSGLRATLEQWQQAIDDRIRAVLPDVSTIRELQADLKGLSDRLTAIEKLLDESKPE